MIYLLMQFIPQLAHIVQRVRVLDLVADLVLDDARGADDARSVDAVVHHAEHLGVAEEVVESGEGLASISVFRDGKGR